MKACVIPAILIGAGLLAIAQDAPAHATPAPAAQTGSLPPRHAHDLRRVMFIGDSITHGVGAASYRWALHQIWADNDVAFEVIGVEVGNRYADQGIAPGAVYCGRVFNNRHCSMTSERAYEISGRRHTSPRLGASGIRDWLRLNADYDGPYQLREGETPDTCFILIGTNDILGDYDGRFDDPQIMQQLTHALLDDHTGDMSLIVSAIRSANPAASIIVLTIPTWHDTPLNNTAAAHAAIAQYNKALMAWAERKGVLAVDINRVLTDTACEEMPGKAVADFFHAEDKLHPSAQGDLLIGGLVAQAMGMPGRTAGLPRCAEEECPPLFPGIDKLKTGETLHTESPCATFAFTPRVSVSPTHGRDAQQGLSLTLGSPSGTGKLTVTESYIIWGAGRILYSGDMSQNAQSVRIAWRGADRCRGIAGGFYVWLGDMLIGEALPGEGAAAHGATLQNNSPHDALVGRAAASHHPTAPGWRHAHAARP